MSAKPKFSETNSIPLLSAALVAGGAKGRNKREEDDITRSRVSDLIDVGDLSAWNDDDNDFDIDI